MSQATEETFRIVERNTIARAIPAVEFAGLLWASQLTGDAAAGDVRALVGRAGGAWGREARAVLVQAQALGMDVSEETLWLSDARDLERLRRRLEALAVGRAESRHDLTADRCD